MSFVSRNVAENRKCPNSIGLSSNCIADRCMAWRWEGDIYGYCGIAGKPDKKSAIPDGDFEDTL